MKLKTILTWVGILAAAVASFHLGRRSVPSTESESSSVSPSSLLGKRQDSLAQLINASADPRPRTPRQRLEMKWAIGNLSVNELIQLWDSRATSFDLNHGADREIAEAILKKLGQLAPSEAIARAEKTGSRKYAMLAIALAGWATADQDAAVQWCRDQSDVRAGRTSLTAIIDDVGATDRNQAIDLYLDVVGDKTLRAHQWSPKTLFTRWAKEDPSAAIDAAQRIHDATSNNWAIRYTIEAWAKFDSDGAATWVADIEAESLRRRGYNHLFAGWAEVDPAAAAAYALTLKGKDVFNDSMLHVLDGWAHTDFDSAAGWIDDLEDGETRAPLQRLLVERAQGFANREPGLEYALRHLESNPEMMKAINQHAHELAMRDPEKAFAWAEENLTNPDHQEAFRHEIRDQLASNLPEEAVPYLAELPNDHPEHAKLHEKVARHWAHNDPENARAWLEKLPEGQAQEAALLGYTEGWMRDTTQHDAAARWIDAFPQGNTRDQLSDIQARALMNIKNIQPAIDAAAKINDPFLRDQTFENILKTWYRDEIKAEAAMEFIESTDLISDTVRWRVLNRKDGHP